MRAKVNASSYIPFVRVFISLVVLGTGTGTGTAALCTGTCTGTCW